MENLRESEFECTLVQEAQYAQRSTLQTVQRGVDSATSTLGSVVAETKAVRYHNWRQAIQYEQRLS